MTNHGEPDFASTAAALGDASRARMVLALMDGRARTATELALEGEVSPSTASVHLARLVDAGLVSRVQQGRHRYFRILDPTVAAGIEGLLAIAAQHSARAKPLGPSDPALREARVCFDHLAGALGVMLKASMIDANYLIAAGGAAHLTDDGRVWLTHMGIDVGDCIKQRRPLCRPCLDWSERRMHLAGSVGSKLLARMLELGMLRRTGTSRALIVSSRARIFARTLLFK